MATQLDLNALGKLAASGVNAKSYRFVVAKRDAGVSAASLRASPNPPAGGGVIVSSEVPDAGGKAELALEEFKRNLESAGGAELLTFVVGIGATPDLNAVTEGPTLQAGAPSSSVEERRYDYFKALITGTLPGLVAAGKMEWAKGSGEFAEGEKAINIFGIRSMLDFQPQPPREWKFDDWLVQVWIEGGKKRVEGFKGTTDPGKSQAAKGLCSHVCDGHWRYKYGTHNGYPACNPLAMSWWNDANADNKGGGAGEKKYSNFYQEANGHFMAHCNLHAGGSGDEVGDWSAGCQVLNYSKTSAEYQRWISRVEQAPNRTDFPYTLIDSGNLPGAIPS